MILNLKGKGSDKDIKEISDIAKVFYNAPKVESRSSNRNFEMRIYFENEIDLYNFRDAVEMDPRVNVAKLVTVPYSEN